MFPHSEPSPSEAWRPLLVPISVHPRARDIHSRSLEVEVVRHRTSGHKLGDKGLIVLVPQREHVEQESVACLPDPFLQNSDSPLRFGSVPKIKYCEGPEFR